MRRANLSTSSTRIPDKPRAEIGAGLGRRVAAVHYDRPAAIEAASTARGNVVALGRLRDSPAGTASDRSSVESTATHVMI
jgi:hypothetical protein